jgi:branched-chain amino acid transport system permease protein
MNSTLFLQQILNGIAVGSIYAIFALGYTLVFSILRVINFAHGAVFTLGAYFTYVLTGSRFGFNGVLANTAMCDYVPGPLRGIDFLMSLCKGFPFPIALLGGAVLAGLVGIFIERVAFRPLRARGADPLLSLVSSLGVAVAIVNIIQYLVGAEIYSYPSNPFGQLPPAINFAAAGAPPMPVRTVQIIIFGVAMVIVVLLTLLINRTKIGKALQAVSEDVTTSSLLGINPDRLILLTFFLSSFLGGVAGTLVGINVSIAGPYFGIAFGLKGLAVIVLGGLGDIPGAVIGGFVIGIGESLIPTLLEALAQVPPGTYSAYKDAVAFAVLFIVLLIRPQGILGRAVIQKV